MKSAKSILKVSEQGVSKTNLDCVVVTVCLRPAPVSPELASFGVIVKCDDGGFFGYKLAQGDERAMKRIAGFFPRCGRDGGSTFVAAMDDPESELERQCGKLVS